MILKFWGVRGSLPTPLTSEKLESKIQAIISSISPKDLENQDSRQKFLLSLNGALTSSVGGNTSCVSLKINDSELFVMDAGTGLRELGQNLDSGIKKVHIFLSHFHWDHIQGIPFFDAIYDKNIEIHFYSPDANLKKYLKVQMTYPFFPVEFEKSGAKFFFHNITVDSSFCVSGTYICCHEISHPGKSYSYLFNLENGKKLLYATDFEISLKDFELNESNRRAFENADIMILDSQYTASEYFEKNNWGHPMFAQSVDFAHHYKCRKLFFFHYDPLHDDKTLYDILDTARTYAAKYMKSNMDIFLAKEGDFIDIV